ncbi:hypothetical protein SESBI_41117 [Sesbania bispinosa]|nr:hypothetical protein SESBI_41117 [Sesbania bispinosa]
MAPSKKNVKKKGKSSEASPKKKKIHVKRSKSSSGFKKQLPGESSQTLVLFSPSSSRAEAPQRAKKSKASRASGSGASASQSTPFDESKFRSLEHFQKYHAKIKKRTIIPDRNLLLKEAEYPEIQAIIAKLRWEFFCQIAGQGRQGLTFEFYANGWRKKDEDWPEFTTFVRGKMVKFDSAHINKILCIGDDPSIYGPTFADFFRRRPDFQEILQVLCCSDVVWLPINQPKHKALKMGDLQPFPRAWGAFIIASVLPVLHDTTLLLDRAKLLFAIIKGMKIDLGSIISKEMENIMSSKTKSLAYPSLITLLCLDVGVTLSDDDIPISAAKTISARRISEYKLAFQKKQPNAPSTSRPPPPRSQAEFNQLILDNQAQILENQATLTQAIAALARRQNVLYRSLKRGQLILAKNLFDIPSRVHTEAPLLNLADFDDELLGEHLGHQVLPPFPSASQSFGDNDNEDDGPASS